MQSSASSIPASSWVLKLGATQNVWVKISAPYRNGAAGESFAKEAYPLLRSAYGLDRLLWGSDWPHTQFEATQSYAKNREFLDTLIVDKSERTQLLAPQRQLFGSDPSSVIAPIAPNFGA